MSKIVILERQGCRVTREISECPSGVKVVYEATDFPFSHRLWDVIVEGDRVHVSANGEQSRASILSLRQTLIEATA